MNIFKPMLFTDLKGYGMNQFLKDIISGIIVAVIALPLSIALAIASGVAPEAGIYTAVVAGFIIAVLGGSDDEGKPFMDVPDHVSVYEFNGPMFFAVAGPISELPIKDGINCIILRMRSVMSLDTDALRGFEALLEKCEERGATVLISHINPQPLKAMKKAGIYDMIGKENFCTDINSAMERAKSLGKK